MIESIWRTKWKHLPLKWDDQMKLNLNMIMDILMIVSITYDISPLGENEI